MAPLHPGAARDGARQFRARLHVVSGAWGSAHTEIRFTEHGVARAAFRGYADYMATEAFAEGLDRLLNLASGLRTAVMCAESLWWRCHRGLIADVLRWLQFEVIHILGPGSTTSHPYTAAARIVSGRLSYSAAGAA